MASLWQMFKNSSIIIKLLVIAVVVVWTAALTAMGALFFLATEQPVVAQLPTPGAAPANPMISLDPPAGTVDTSVTVFGQDWTPGSTVLIFLSPAYGTGSSDYAVSSAGVDQTGRFQATFLLPANPTWQMPGLVRVMARAGEDQAGAEAFFSLLAAGEQPTDTPTTTPEPTVTATPEPAVTPAPTATPAPATPQLTTVTDLNIRGGPGMAYEVLGLLKAGQTAEITGLSADGRWWQINFAGSATGRGWVAGQYVTAQNVANVPVVQAGSPPAPPTATPQPTATPVIITDWRGEYYNNAAMSGSPLLVRNDSDINFDWGTRAPAAGVGPDNFSVRWTRTLYFPAAAYRFTVRADDGVLLWVDDRLLIDQWRDSSATIHTADINLTDGLHTIKMAYYDRAGDAVAQLRWDRINVFPDWKGEYYNNRNLNGAPSLVRNDPTINFNWGGGSPAAGLPADSFSVRWTREVYFPAGTYRFTAVVDDGIRLWVDDRLVIDQWRDSSPTSYAVNVELREGNHSVRVEYYDRLGGAQAQLSWSRTDSSFPDWKGEYFNNRRLDGSPVVVRNDRRIDFDWGKGSPAPGVDSDNFSVRWSRKVDLDEGAYLIRVRVDDGVRLWLDDKLLIDSWQDGRARDLEARTRVSKGQYRLKIEYYERSGDAEIEVTWQKQNEPANQPPQAMLNSAAYTVTEGGTLSFDGSGSKDPDGSIVAYDWDFNYNGSAFTVQASGPTVTHLYPDGPASQTVALRVTDNTGATQLATAPVTVQNLPPAVEAGGPYAGQVGAAITLAGTAVDPGVIDQTGLVYQWDFGDGSQGSGPIVSHTFGAAGSYTARLTVADKDGGQSSDTATVVVSAVNQPPQAVINGSSRGLVDETFSFSGSASGDSDGSIVSYAWDFGDGGSGSGLEVNHIYASEGVYKVTLTVTDNGGLSASAGMLVQVELPVQINLPPQAMLGGPVSGLVNEVLSFSATGSSDQDGQIISYTWDFGDGVTASGENVTHAYATAGSYKVSLMVTDDGGLTANAGQLVDVSDGSQSNSAPDDEVRPSLIP